MIESTTCCGVKDIDGLSSRNNPRVSMKEFAMEYFEDKEKAPIALFTGNTRYTYARDFAEYIKQEKLGIVTNTQRRLNLNSGNNIRAYLWSINKRNLKAFCLRNFPRTFGEIFDKETN